MPEVAIVYNTFLHSMKIHINGKPIPPISRLTRFQSMPFELWCNEIFPAIAEEVNDRFSVTYIGRLCESHVLSSFMASCSFCSAYVNRQPDISDSALTRLKKLSSLCQSGVSCERFLVEVYIYTDLQEEMVSQTVKACLPKLAYCKITPKVKPLQAFSEHRAVTPAFIICSENAVIPATRTQKACVLQLSNGFGKISCKSGIFSEKVRPDMLEGSLKAYLELLLYPEILKKALQSVKVPQNSPLYSSVTILDKTEPQIIVTLPSSIEFGEIEEVRVRTIPEGADIGDLIYRISDESVITRTEKGLKAIGTGEAVVEVYIAGQTVKLCSSKITAYRRNRIQTLHIKETEIQMHVGEKATLSYTYTPENADNVSSVKLISSDGTIASPDYGMTFVARRPGSCRMHVQAEKVSADIPVKVYPVLESLSLEIEKTNVGVGQIVPLKVTRHPENATLDKLSFHVEPSSVGIYDTATHSFYAKGRGKGTITVSDKSGRVKASCEVSVSGTSRSSNKGCLTSVLGILAICALALILLL